MAINSTFPLLIFVMGFFPVIIALVVRRRVGMVGDARLTEPHCAKCGYDLRGYTAEPPTRCSECGADLTARHAVRWGEISRNRAGARWIAAVAIAVGVMMFVIIKLLTVRHVMMVPAFAGPAGLNPGGATNQALLASLGKMVQQPWDWQELDRRLSGGTLSNTETATAIDCLIADLGTRTSYQPLQWSEQFVRDAIFRGAISNAQYLRLAQALHRTANVKMATKVRQGRTWQFSVDYGGPWDLPGVVLLKALRPVKLDDGTEIRAYSFADPNYGRGTPNSDYLSSSDGQAITGTLQSDLPPGKYVANFVLDAGEYVQPNGSRNTDPTPGQAAHWSATVRAKWTEQIAVPFEVVPADQSPVTLITDSNLDPQKNGAIVVKMLRAIHYGAGQRIIVELTVDGNAVPCCFDVRARVAGRESPLGSVFASSGVASMNGGVNLKSLPAEVRSIDLIFRPNPARAEGVVGMDHIWGTTIELLNQPLQRYDLDGQATTQQ